ncbi:RNA polymerase sigma factor, partial [Candidatus Peregrinibacteria bacterium]|nr:RNA polymerase sigma factor [Candidatus Peregrinibacteria bacterium]
MISEAPPYGGKDVRVASNVDIPKEDIDEELMELVKIGSEPAYTKLYNRYAGQIYDFIHYRKGFSHEFAEEVVIDTFANLWRKCHFFDSSRRFRPWIFGVADHAAVDLHRKYKRHWNQYSLDVPLAGSPDFGHDTFGDLIEAPEDLEPSIPAMCDETKEDVRNAVESLPENSRNVITLIFLNGMKYREAAEELGIPVGTVKSRVHAALR